jgi:MFS family permease
MNTKRLKKLKRNIPLLVTFRSLGFGIAFVMPTLYDFWTRFGMTMAHVGILETAFAMEVVLLELPSGILADRLGRKRSLLLGNLAWISGFGIYLTGEHFSSFFVAEFFIALGIALTSGADQALLYDSLAELRARHRYAHLAGLMLSIQIALMALGNVMGSWLYNIDYRLPWMIAIGLEVLRLPLGLKLEEPQREGDVKAPLLPFIRSTLHNPAMVWILSYSGILIGFTSSMVWIYQPYLKLLEVPILWNGPIFAVLNITAAVAASLAPRLLLRVGTVQILAFLGITLFVGLAAMSTLSWLGVAGFLTQQVIRGIGRLTVLQELQRSIPSSHRASLVSCNELVSRLAYATIMLPLGWSVDLFGLGASLAVCTGLSGCMLGAAWLYRPTMDDQLVPIKESG